MRVKRVVTNVAGKRVSAAKRFYQDVLGLDLLMDLGWIATYGLATKMSIQVSFLSQVDLAPRFLTSLLKSTMWTKRTVE